MSLPVISQKQARKMVLQSQGLLHVCKTKRPLKALEAMIQHLGYIQIDTISVIERAHHHVLGTRLKAYQPTLLDQLVQEKKVFEYWYHAASYLPISDFRFCLPRMARLRKKEPYRFDRSHPLYRQVLKRVQAEGPLQAKDFESDPTERTGWWDWKPAKRALEQLFIEGRLLVVGRKGFQKIYDLPERALPAGLNQTTPSQKELVRFLIQRGIQAHGIITEPQTRHLRDVSKKEGQTMLHEMQEAGEVTPVHVEKSKAVYWTFPHLLEQSLRLPRKKQFFFLSPFDNLVIQRNRLKELFDFDYQLECYLPASKRQYGYFSLPMLWGNTFVGRVDMKAERKSKTLILKNLVLEDQTPEWQAFATDCQKALFRFMAFNGCEKIEVLQTKPKRLKQELKKLQ